MIAWITENIITIAVCLVIAGLVALALISMLKNRKKGRNCSCGCEGCAYSGSCGEAGKRSLEKTN